MIHKVVILGLVLLVLAACASTPSKPPKPDQPDEYYIREALDWIVQEKMRRFDVTGMSIAVIHGQDVIYAKGYGYRDREEAIPADETTLYRVGSITKLFTAMAVMQLVDDGKIRLDAPITKYLPQFNIQSRFANTRPITVRQLLTHHSGLPSDYLQDACATPQITYESLLTLLDGEYAAYPNGELFAYSNVGYSLLGLIVEAVTGQTYENYIAENLLQPLQMHASSVNGRLEEPHLSRAYYQGEVFDECPIRDVPASGMNSNVMDLTQFAKLVHAEGEYNKQQILPSHLLRQMYVQQNKKMPLDLTKRVGLSWMFYDNYLGTTRVYGHDGRTLAHTALLLTEPSAQVSVIVLSNSLGKEGNAVFSTGREILREVWPIFSERKIHWMQHLRPPEKPRRSEQDLSGRYATSLGIVEIEKRSDQKYRVYAVGRKLALIPHKKDKNSFRLSYKFAGIFPIDLGWVGQLKIQGEDVENRRLLVGYSGPTKRLIGEKITPQTIEEVWFQRAGRYYPVENLEPDMFKVDYFELLPESNYLIARVVPKEGEVLEFGLIPQNNGQAIVAGLGRNLGSTVFFDENRARFLGLEFVLRSKADIQ